MPFPLSYEGAFRIHAKVDNIPELILRIEPLLRRKIAQGVHHKTNSIVFKGRYITFPEPFPMLSMVSNGSVTLTENNDRIQVNYCLRFLRLLIYPTILSLLIIASWGKDFNVGEILWTLAIIIGLCLAEYYITAWRFRKLLMKALQSDVAT